MKTVTAMFLLVFACALPVDVAQAQSVAETAEQREDRERQLTLIRESIQTARDHKEELETEIETLDREIAAVNRALAKSAARTQELEVAVAETESRIERLSTGRARIRTSLALRRVRMIEVLAALQRMGANPPPALLVQPSDALASVRSAQLLGAVVPQLKGEAARLNAELANLARTEQAIGREKQLLADQLNNLSEDEAKLASLIRDKSTRLEQSRQEIVSDAERADSLEEQAKGLEVQIAALDATIATEAETTRIARLVDEERVREEAARLKEARDRLRSGKAEEGAPIDLLSPTLDARRTEPAIALSKAKGLLPVPVDGQLAYGFGTPVAVGSRGRGQPSPDVAFITEKRAQVRSPADGLVAFAGPFRSYGHLVILDAGEKYHIVLSGMAAASVPTGRFVVAGEIIGRMGERRLSRSAASPVTQASLGADRPVLYVEFRKDGDPVDPAPWWRNARTAMVSEQ